MQSATVNLNLLHKLLRDNKDAIRKALDLFVNTTEEDMAEMGKLISQRQLLNASRIAHSLKSRFVYLGNDDTLAKVKELERVLKLGQCDEANTPMALFDELNEIISCSLDEIRQEIVSL